MANFRKVCGWWGLALGVGSWPLMPQGVRPGHQSSVGVKPGGWRSPEWCLQEQSLCPAGKTTPVPWVGMYSQHRVLELRAKARGRVFFPWLSVLHISVIKWPQLRINTWIHRIIHTQVKG